jgi:hypothetical protein
MTTAAQVEANLYAHGIAVTYRSVSVCRSHATTTRNIPNTYA